MAAGGEFPNPGGGRLSTPPPTPMPRNPMKTSRRALLFGLILGLAACAGYDGRGLRPGEARLADVERVMGPPAMRWQAPDGALRLAYPRGPLGFHTYMVEIAADGRLSSIENVLEPRGFATVHAGQSMDEVLRLLGPSDPPGTVYFEARDELVWDWRYCDDWNEPAHFYVLFDGTTKKVRSTMSLTESQIRTSPEGRAYCGR